MAQTTMTYGTMPSRELFGARFKNDDAGRDGALFLFGNDPRVGSCGLTEGQLWDELWRARRDCEEGGDEAAGDWCSAVLGCLGIEWV